MTGLTDRMFDRLFRAQGLRKFRNADHTRAGLKETFKILAKRFRIDAKFLERTRGDAFTLLDQP